MQDITSDQANESLIFLTYFLFLAESLASASGVGQVFDSELSDDSNSGHDISALLDHLDKKLS